MSNKPEGAGQRALALQLFGKFTTIETTVVVGVVSAVLLKNNPERIGYILVNTGGARLTFAITQDVTEGKGLLLPELGDTLSTTYIEDGQFPTHELSAIAGVGGSEVFIIQFIRVGL